MTNNDDITTYAHNLGVVLSSLAAAPFVVFIACLAVVLCLLARMR
jgi:hypothetical protein